MFKRNDQGENVETNESSGTETHPEMGKIEGGFVPPNPNPPPNGKPPIPQPANWLGKPLPSHRQKEGGVLNPP